MECIKCEHKLTITHAKIVSCDDSDLIIEVRCSKCLTVHHILYQQTMIVNVKKV